MGRKYRNESYTSISVDNQHEGQQEHSISKVKIPNYNKVTYKEKISEDLNGNPIYGEAEFYCNNFHYTKEQVIQELEKNGLEVVKFEPMTITMLVLCPNCNKEGIPKIDRRPNKYDYHVYQNSIRSDDNGVTKRETNRPDDFVLTYSHKIGDTVKKCTIGKLDKNHLNIIKKGKVHAKMKQHIFPFYIESMKNS